MGLIEHMWALCVIVLRSLDDKPLAKPVMNPIYRRIYSKTGHDMLNIPAVKIAIRIHELICSDE